MTHRNVQLDLQKQADPKRAVHSLRFFKTGKGEYGEGDRFIGVTVPEQRRIAKQYANNVSLSEIVLLLKSKIHEYRLTALIMLVYRFQKAGEAEQKKIYDLYLRHAQYINNWDLVDVTTPTIVGGWLLNRNKRMLYTLAKSKNMWERRIAILATLQFIRNKKLSDAFALARVLLHDTEDLIHKAVGWMLREAGKVDKQKLQSFLRTHATGMPRTMLRYAIEKFSPKERSQYLKQIPPPKKEEV